MKAIAIDGPAGAGKTTMAKLLAKAIGYKYVDTGAMYRAIAQDMLQKGRGLDDIGRELSDFSMAVEYDDSEQRIIIGGVDVTSRLRAPEVSKLASDISAIPSVRAALLDEQLKVARDNNVVMEGRDIGTVILPNADIKFFLTADLLVRAQRRYRELCAKGNVPDPVGLAAQMQVRDTNDSTRESAPLMAAPDAILIDSSDLSIQRVREMMLYVFVCHAGDSSGRTG